MGARCKMYNTCTLYLYIVHVRSVCVKQKEKAQILTRNKNKIAGKNRKKQKTFQFDVWTVWSLKLRPIYRYYNVKTPTGLSFYLTEYTCDKKTLSKSKQKSKKYMCALWGSNSRPPDIASSSGILGILRLWDRRSDVARFTLCREGADVRARFLPYNKPSSTGAFILYKKTN
jgi:hypothetical protein